MCCPDCLHRARHLPLLWYWKVFQVRHWLEKYRNTPPNISAIVPRLSRFTSFSLNQTRPLVLKTVWADGRPLTQLSNLTSDLSSRVLLTTELQSTSKSVDKLVLSSTSSIPVAWCSVLPGGNVFKPHVYWFSNQCAAVSIFEHSRTFQTCQLMFWYWPPPVSHNQPLTMFHLLCHDLNLQMSHSVCPRCFQKSLPMFYPVSLVENLALPFSRSLLSC